jgi:hypothetical protein
MSGRKVDLGLGEARRAGVWLVLFIMAMTGAAVVWLILACTAASRL